MNINYRPTRLRLEAIRNHKLLPHVSIGLGLGLKGKKREDQLLKYACQNNDHMLVKVQCTKRNFKYSTLNDALHILFQQKYCNYDIAELLLDKISVRCNDQVTTAFGKCLATKDARIIKTSSTAIDRTQELTAKVVKQMRVLERMLMRARDDYSMLLMAQTLIRFISVVDKEYKSMLERTTEITTSSCLHKVLSAFLTDSACRNLELSELNDGSLERLNLCKQHLVSEATRCLLNANRLACYHGRLATVQLLSRHFRGRNAADKEVVLNEHYSSWTLLSSSVVQTQITSHFLRESRSFCVNKSSDKGNTMLHHVIWRQENDGKTPLHEAVEEFDVNKTGKVLFRNDECIDVQDNYGRTALHMACFYGHMELTRVLVSLWADPVITDDMGRLPRDIATERGHFSITDYLLANSM